MISLPANRAQITYGLVVATLVVAGIGGLFQVQASAHADSLDDGTKLPVISALSRPYDTADAVPRYLVGDMFESEGIREEAERLLGETPGAMFWAAPTEKGDICFMILLTDTSYASMSCQSPTQFEKHGIGLQAGNTEVAVRAYLLPDGVSGAIAGLERASNNLLVGDATAGSPTKTQLTTSLFSPDNEIALSAFQPLDLEGLK